MERKELASKLQHMMFLISRSREIYGETHLKRMRGKDIMVLKTIDSLRDKNPVKMNEIASFFHVSAPATSQFIHRLDKMGYIKREKLEDDKRSVGICISDKARQEISENEHFFLEQILDLIDYLGEEDATKMLELMSKSYHFMKNKE